MIFFMGTTMLYGLCCARTGVHLIVTLINVYGDCNIQLYVVCLVAHYTMYNNRFSQALCVETHFRVLFCIISTETVVVVLKLRFLTLAFCAKAKRAK